MKINMKEINSEEFGHCLEITNENTEILVTIEYGPRIVSIRKNNGKSLIYCGKDEVFGRCHGHKMRITLEKSTNAIYCDNRAVVYSVLEDGVKFVQTLTEPIPLEFSMSILPDAGNGEVHIIHTVSNKSKETAKLSIYTETPFLHEGFVYVPQSLVPEKEKPAKVLTLWNGVDWTDERLYIGKKYITVSKGENPVRLKIGSNNTSGTCGYINQKQAFIKTYIHNIGALYPFCSCSTFATSGQEYLSIQTSSPFYRLAPGETANHTEIWTFQNLDSMIYFNEEEKLDEFSIF